MSARASGHGSKSAPQACSPYVDHVLAVLPFEPEVMQRARRSADDLCRSPVGKRCQRPVGAGMPERQKRTVEHRGGKHACCCRGHAAAKSAGCCRRSARRPKSLRSRHPDMRFLLPTVPQQENLVRQITASWPVKPEITVGAAAKWQAFAEADAAVAASGTVILELALAGIPVVSTYKTDWIIRLMHKRIKIWTAAHPQSGRRLYRRAGIPERSHSCRRSVALDRTSDGRHA